MNNIRYRYIFERTRQGAIDDAKDFKNYLNVHFRAPVEFAGYIMLGSHKSLDGAPKICWQAMCEDKPTFTITNIELSEKDFSIGGYHVHVYQHSLGKPEVKCVTFS